MQDDSFCQLFSQGINGIQRCHGFLENHGHGISSDFFKFRFFKRKKFPSRQFDTAVTDAGIVGIKELHDGQ